MPAKVTLTVTDGKLRGQQFVFADRTTCIVGRADGCEPRLPDDKEHKTFGDVRWKQQVPSVLAYRGHVPPLVTLLAGKASDDPTTGGQLVEANSGGRTVVAKFVLKDADENGDGTVPVRSGKAPGSKAQVCVGYPGVDHEGGYKSDATRRFTLWAITKIAQNVKGTVLQYKA